MTMDANYVIPTRTSIYSILNAANKNTFYEIHIICDENLDYISRKTIIELEKNSKQVKIIFDEVNEVANMYLKEAKTFSRFPIASYYRLFISRILTVDKCIFVDGDTIICIDLTEVFNMDIDDFYVAGVKDAQISKLGAYEKELKIPSLKEYINAGFLLFNLKKIREYEIDKKFIDAIGNGYKLMDQDIINKYCYGKIKFLALRYNFFADFFEIKKNQTDNKIYSYRDFQDMKKKIGVLHYNGFFKPWLCTRLKVNQIWWDYAKKALCKDDYNKQVDEAKQFEEKSDWSYILRKIENENQIVVFGFSDIGKSSINLLNKFNIEKVVGICDNDEKKQGLNYQGINVLSVEEAVKRFPSAFWVITSQNRTTQISEQLQKMGINEKKIVRYIFKSSIYYNGLDDKYVDYELQMIRG